MFNPKTTISGRLENSSGEWVSSLDGVKPRIINPSFRTDLSSSGEWIRIPQLNAATVRITKRPGCPGLVSSGD